MRISGQLWGHCIRVLRVEWAGWSFFAVKCLRLTLGFVPIEASIVTHMSDWSMRKSQLQSLETLHPWSLNWTLLLAIFFFFFKWHRNRNEATLSHSGFLQHMHCPFHYSWCVFTDSALNHEEYSCLSFPKRALWNERTCTWGAHTKKSLFSSGFGENHMS